MEFTSVNNDESRAKVAAGFKGGPFFKNPILHPSMTIVDGVPSEVKEEFGAKSIPAIKLEDPWYGRRK